MKKGINNDCYEIRCLLADINHVWDLQLLHFYELPNAFFFKLEEILFEFETHTAGKLSRPHGAEGGWRRGWEKFSCKGSRQAETWQKKRADE